MTSTACPNCGEPASRRLERLTRVAQVEYYRCPSCNHVWTVAKDGSGTVTHITPLSEPKNKSDE